MRFPSREAVSRGRARWFFCLGLLPCAAVWPGHCVPVLAAGGRSDDSVVAAEDEDAGPSAPTESRGPWGSLEAYEVFISAPESILDLFPIPSGITTWTFQGMSADEVAAVLDRPDIPAGCRAELLDRSRWSLVDGRYQISPSVETLLAIPAAARAAIYAALARWPENEFQASPYFVPHGDVRSWLARSGLRTDLVDAVERTVYPAGRATCFSDVSLLVSLTMSHAESRDLLKALSRTQTAILRLRLDSESDLRQIEDYWNGDAGTAQDWMPLLESTATNPQIRSIDLVQILPPTARKLAYTFPHPSQAIDGRYPDCHWTSLNFFNHRPEPRLVETIGANRFVLENFRPSDPPFRYGDVLFMTDAVGNALHSCVYLAADYVFTKNGSNVLSPWIIAKLDDVKDRYSRDGEPTVSIYRRAK